MKILRARDIVVKKHTSVKVKAAVLLDESGKVHSAMLSRMSMWSAGQRMSGARRRKKHPVLLTKVAVELVISRAMLCDMYHALMEGKSVSFKDYFRPNTVPPPRR